MHRTDKLFLFIWMTATLGINDQVNETEMKTTSQVTNFIKQTLSFLAYDGRSTVKPQNYFSFDMWRMIRFEVEISVSVGGFLYKF
jgi:hypothetical protein